MDPYSGLEAFIMKNAIVNLWRMLVRGGLSREEFDEVKIPVRIENYRTWRVFSWVVTVCFSALFGLSYLLPLSTLAAQRTAYLAGAAPSLVLAIIITAICKRSPAVLPLVYLQNIILLATAIVISAVNAPGINAVTFCVFLLAVPLMVLDKPWRMDILIVLATLAFSAAASYFKEPDIAVIDATNTVMFALLSIIINKYTTRQRLRSQQFRNRIEMQRDTDDLTGLQNKSSIMRDINRYLEREEDEAIFIIFDIDHFKSINDTFGHDVGDSILTGVGECIAREFDATNVRGRFGGDEFILFLRHTGDMDAACAACERLLADVNRIMLPDGSDFVRCSMGLALREKGVTNEEVLFRKADSALYQAKNTGRNRLVVYGNDADDEISAEAAAERAAEQAENEQTDTALMLAQDKSRDDADEAHAAEPVTEAAETAEVTEPAEAAE